jgi:hypothetical protein
MATARFEIGNSGRAAAAIPGKLAYFETALSIVAKGSVDL